MAKLNYPVDYTGLAATNLIVDELISVQPPANLNEASFVVPRAAPFFTESLEIYTAKGKKGTKLVEGRDYFIVYKFVAGTNIVGHPLAGGISFTNSLYSGNIYFNYQTLGGDFVVDDVTLLEQTVRQLYSNIRFVRWDQIGNMPNSFPPDAHKHPIDVDCTLGDVSLNLQLIANAIIASTSGSEGTGLELIRSHIAAVKEAHTPGAVGLGNVANYAIATEEEAATARNDRYMTPAVTAYMIRRQIQDLEVGTIEDNLEDLTNKVNGLELTLKQLTMIVLSISDSVEDLNNSLNLYRQEIANLAAKVDEVQETANTASVIASQALAQAAATEHNLQQIAEEVNEVLYTGTIVLPAGDHLITIPAGQAMLISIVGGGGGSGKWYQSSAIAAQLGGSLTDGSDSIVYYLGTQSQAVEPLPILFAGGGRAGVNSYGEIGATTAGKGGKTYRFRSERLKVSELDTADLSTDYVEGSSDTFGTDGKTGDTSNNASIVTGVGGWGVFTTGLGILKYYGRGGHGTTRASTGGSGGRWEVTLHNDTREPARIALSIGKAGSTPRAVVNEITHNPLDQTVADGVATMIITA